MFEDVWGDFVNHVVLDVVSELGIAIFGGAITAYLLEYLQKNNMKITSPLEMKSKGD